MRTCSICLFVSAWFHLAYCLPGSSLLLQISQAFSCSFSPVICLSPKPNRSLYSLKSIPRASYKVPCISSPHSLNTHLTTGWSFNQHWRGNELPCRLKFNVLHCNLTGYNCVKDFLLSKTKMLFTVDIFLLFCSVHFPPLQNYLFRLSR